MPPGPTAWGHTRTRMDWHDGITMLGAQAAAMLAVGALVTAAWRWVKRMRAKTREAFAKSIGTHTAAAIAPIAERLDSRVAAVEESVQQMRSEWDARRQVDDQRWAKTEGLYDRLHEHMDAEDNRGQ